MTDALLLVGRDRYGDPWHDHAAVAAAVAEVLQAAGVRAHVRSTFPATFEDPVALTADLVVVVAGRGPADPADDGAWAGFHRTLAARVAAGTPLLALHASANTFADAPGWSDLLGGRWVEGTSWHPPLGEETFEPVDPTHPVTAGLGPVRAVDETYCDLEVRAGSRVLLVGRHDGVAHPVVWQGPGRVVYDGLGHDVRSWASAERRDLLLREVRWLLDPAPA